MQPSLFDFSVIRPSEERSQQDILIWLAKAHAKSENSAPVDEDIKNRLFALGTGSGKIERRATQILKYLNLEDLWQIKQGMSVKARSDCFDLEATSALENFYTENTPLPSHLIHVSCTGYITPSCAQKLVSKRNAETTVTNAYHMGCYASMPAVRIGAGFLGYDGMKTDIVHTELCSLHMNPAVHDTGQLVIQTLFGDGFIKYSLDTRQKALEKGNALHVLALHEEIIPNSLDLMTWSFEDWGMKMTIAKEVPGAIAGHLQGFVSKLIQKAGLDPESTSKKAIFAIHPGGPKIIEKTAKLLLLGEEQTFHSKKILAEFGNMSSATLPHIWKAILDDPSVPGGTLAIALAFGPGLTISGAIYEKGVP